MDSTLPPTRRAMLALSLGLAGCAATGVAPRPAIMTPKLVGEGFVARDGALLPARHWVPEGEVRRVVLALHGFNDSRDAWELPAPAMAAAGSLVFAPDQRGFGAAPGRGLWAGGARMVDDAADMVAALKATYRGLPLFLMGESMGGAVLMNLATRADAPDVAGYVLLAPAVWGRARMNMFMRGGLWFTSTFLPGVTASRPPPQIKIYPSDNPEAMRRLATNPLTIKETRFDALAGLVDLMDDALAAAARFSARSLFMYGTKDDIVPPAATRATWRALPPGPRRAIYAEGYHLLMRDLGRALPIGDAIAWMNDPAGPLPSGAEARVAAWLAAG